MEIRCPKCLSTYQVPEEQLTAPVMKAVCKSCGEKIVIRRDGEKAESPRAEPSSPAPSGYISIMDLSPPYPKHRDKLILAAFVLGLLILFVAGYWSLRGAGDFVIGFPERPLRALTAMLMGKEVNEPCEAFLVRNRDAFPQTGRILRISPVKVETRSVNREKTATVVMKVRGTKGTRDFVFRLQKQNGAWRITSAAVDMGGGRLDPVFPKPESKG